MQKALPFKWITVLTTSDTGLDNSTNYQIGWRFCGMLSKRVTHLHVIFLPDFKRFSTCFKDWHSIMKTDMK